jgi:tetraacyldisaccharide 4''-kinase
VSVPQAARLAWRGINRLRRGLYRRGILRAHRLPRPVISVGNRSAGGAGKTPAVIAIARDLSARGLRVAVLTRGYGRASAEAGVVDQLDAFRFGDEPVLIKMMLPQLAVIVGSNRFVNAMRYLETNECDVFLLDDGFQHLQLARDVDVVIDAPGARWLREGASATRHADFVIARRLRVVNAELVQGKRAFAFSGLADNEQFFQTVRDCGGAACRSSGVRRPPPLFARRRRSIRGAAAAVSAEVLVTTQKDAVKLAERDIIPLVVEMVIDPSVLEAIAARIAP